MSPLAVTAAPGLVFEFRGLGAALEREVERYCAPLPASPGSSGALIVSGEPPPLSAAERAAATPLLSEGSLRVSRAGSTTLFEFDGGEAWCRPERGAGGVRVEAGSGSAELFAGRVLTGLLIELGEARGWLGLHAAAAVVAGRGLLLCGPSGSGKSTLVRRLHAAGHGVLSDDVVWLRAGGDRFEVAAFPRGNARPAPPVPTVRRARVDAVVRPAIVDRPASRLVAVSRAEVVDVLTGESGFLGPAAASGRRFRTLVALAGAVPGYRLEAGSRQEEIPPLLASLASAVPASAPAAAAPDTR